MGTSTKKPVKLLRWLWPFVLDNIKYVEQYLCARKMMHSKWFACTEFCYPYQFIYRYCFHLLCAGVCSRTNLYYCKRNIVFFFRTTSIFVQYIMYGVQLKLMSWFIYTFKDNQNLHVFVLWMLAWPSNYVPRG
jgi:hypothetical protein